jgi:hypothetical protein
MKDQEASNSRGNQIAAMQNQLQNIRNTPSSISIPSYRLGSFSNILFRDKPRSHFECTHLNDLGLYHNFVLRNTVGSTVPKEQSINKCFVYKEFNMFRLDTNFNTQAIIQDSILDLVDTDIA